LNGSASTPNELIAAPVVDFHPIGWRSARSNEPIRITRCGFVGLPFRAQNRCVYEGDREATSIRGNVTPEASEVGQ
jgi:hypothetical protein